MGALWASVSPWPPGTDLKRIVSSVGDHHIGKSQQQRLAALEPVHIDEATIQATVERDPANMTLNPWERTPTPTKKLSVAERAKLKALRKSANGYCILNCTGQSCGRQT